MPTTATFTRAMSAGRLASWARGIVVPRVLPRLLESSWLRRLAFRFVSELGIRYRHSPVVMEGRPRLRGGPSAGDRLPDARLTLDGQAVALQRAVLGPHLALVLCGDPEAWNVARLAQLVERFSGLVKTYHLSLRRLPGALACAPDTLTLLGVRDAAQYLVRPDGYIAFRCGGRELDAVTRYLTEWFPSPALT